MDFWKDKTMPKKLVFRGLALPCALLAGLWTSVPASAQTVMRLCTVPDKTHPNNVALEGMIKRVSERTKGQIAMDVFPSSILGNPNDTTEHVRLGAIDMALLAPSHLDKYDPAFATMMLSFMFDNIEHAYRTEVGPAFDWYKEHGRKTGFELIANFAFGFRNITNHWKPSQTG